jgi:hypothetical protein
MVKYFLSSNVEVFPSSLRTIGTSKLTTEKNLTSMVKSSTDNDSYIKAILEDGTIQLVLNGYRFDISKAVDYLVSNFTDNIYATINIQADSDLLVATDGSLTLDVDSEFKGLSLVDNITNETIYLKLGRVSNGTFIPEEKSFVRNSEQSISFDSNIADKNTIMYSSENGLQSGISIIVRKQAEGLPVGKVFEDGSICIVY